MKHADDYQSYEPMRIAADAAVSEHVAKSGKNPDRVREIVYAERFAVRKWVPRVP